MKLRLSFLIICGFLFILKMPGAHAIESLNGFLVSAFDDRFKVISPEKFKTPMEVIVENKTLVRLIGKVIVNSKTVAGYVAVEPEKYQKVIINLKKGDVLHFVPLSPSFQEVELIVGNKSYEIPPKK
jgi:uncharacterized SAM-binding protein YcdF (DUF218 family)